MRRSDRPERLGKTTTLRLVAGLLEPTDGEVTVAGDSLRLDRSRAALSFVPDSPLLYPDLTVREHLELVGLAHGVGDGVDGRVNDLLELFGLTARGDFLPGQLSRGMRQKTQLACALVRPFLLILLDEPVVGLDPPSQQALHRILLTAKQDGAAIALDPPAPLRRRAGRPRRRAPRGPHGCPGCVPVGSRWDHRRPAGIAVSQASAATLEFVRQRRRAHRLPQQRSDRFTGLYTVGLYSAIGAWLGFQALRQSPTRGGSSTWLTDGGLARVATVALLLGLLAALRYATWQGPVVFSAPDVQFLSARRPRAELVRIRLARGLLFGAGVGAALGLVAFVLLEAELGVAAWPLLAAALLGPMALGVLAAALGWLVESSSATARAVLRASPVVLAVAAVAWLGGATAATVDPWSGPWGWAVGPLVAAAGGHEPGWPVQAVLLAVIVLAAVLAAWLRAGRITTEELERRAGTRAGLGASLLMGDPRGVALMRHEVVRGCSACGGYGCATRGIAGWPCHGVTRSACCGHLAGSAGPWCCVAAAR